MIVKSHMAVSVASFSWQLLYGGGLSAVVHSSRFGSHVEYCGGSTAQIWRGWFGRAPGGPADCSLRRIQLRGRMRVTSALPLVLPCGVESREASVDIVDVVVV